MRTKGYKCYNYHCKGRVGDSLLCGEPGDIPLNCEDRIVWEDMDDLIRLSRKAAKEWEGTDVYH